MGERLELQLLLVSVLGSNNVYFQPPPDFLMKYPCILYQRDFVKTDFANNYPYYHKKRYVVTVIDRDPDSSIPDRVAQLPTCIFNRFYAAQQLNHDVFNLFF